MAQSRLQNYIPALTGVRALAAYLVFISHYSYVFDENFPQTVKRFFGEFHIGVTIFFVLSGFLITYRYYNHFHLTTDWFKQYLKNRVARIYPMYALLTIAAFVYFYFTGDQAITKGNNPIAMLIMNITFLRGFFYNFWDTGIAQGWSLTVEECFYFSAPFAFLIMKKYRQFWLQPLVITLTGVLLVLIFRNLNFYGFFGNFTFVMLFTFLGRCFEFFIGIQLALYMLRNGFERGNKIPYTYLGFIAIFVCVYIMALQPVPAGWAAGLQHPVGIFTNNYILPICIALFFYGLLTEGSIMKKVLSNSFVELLGKSSYIFYLVHLGWMYTLLHTWMNNGNDYAFELYDKWQKDWISPFQNDQVNLLIAFVVLNIVSILLFKFIEEPLNHRIRHSNFLIKYKKREAEVIHEVVS
ncbi:acyltransferase [Mucilaginibacter limnophilus]|uniref:Acyltransferase n=1 Tax=Mucilaginibacter limnophilus TaxID=1932778 RepID=A0A437ML45_9SPHI|nr:acyltransferase [Mucilaginibacter limnophilus]RVT98335.1 acyltransferase [Mucilaginibacter limnophilus]